MGGRMARSKGQRGEREVIALLQPIVDKVCDGCGRVRLELKRNLHQRFAKKQYDIDGVPWIALEVKRVENLSGIGGWWRQTLDSTREGQTPVLIYRQNHGQWKVRMRVPVRAGGKGAPVVKCTVTVDLPTFLVWFEQRMRYEFNS